MDTEKIFRENIFRKALYYVYWKTEGTEAAFSRVCQAGKEKTAVSCIRKTAE